jgi:hypothetical protein
MRNSETMPGNYVLVLVLSVPYPLFHIPHSALRI